MDEIILFTHSIEFAELDFLEVSNRIEVVRILQIFYFLVDYLLDVN